ncbi:ASCH domain-containing protein [Sulfitobacter alexandrii]|uniref:ASCH domain-containing protein n=1 Tax=Sulfitobacter alexandrii TaxID=1917485 RepID=A0A1J0WG54_9RHOB|nr:ASCH domain-containing protein [Sulfitobacter alexandrii]APE43110.1 ASCH domain-containing protein [Sulfitobacter alexandrii]
MAKLEEVLARYPGAQTFSFGDTPELISALTALVRSGAKRATCTALADVEAGRETMPVVGRRDVALDADGRPALVIETKELVRTTWAGMTEEMALAEGEDDTLESWRAGHRRYYERHGIFSEDMTLIWERFEVVEAF